MSGLIRISRALVKNNLHHAAKRNILHQTQSRSFSIAAVLQHYGPSVLGRDQVKKMYEQSLSDPETFWGEHARSKLNWTQDFEQVSNSDMNTGKHEWFLNGKINVSGINFTSSPNHPHLDLIVQYGKSGVL